MKRAAYFVFVVTIWTSLGCNGSAPTPADPILEIQFTTPVMARPGSEPFYFAEWPITILDPSGPGGRLEFVDVIVTNVTRGQEVGRNRRPNKDFTYVDDVVPRGGSLTVEAGVVFEMQPSTDELRVTVHVQISDGRAAERSGTLVMAEST